MIIYKKVILFSVLILSAVKAFCQDDNFYAENAVGKITGAGTDYINKRIESIKEVNRAKLPSLKKSITEQVKILESDPLFQPPKGFIVKVVFNPESDAFEPSEDIPACALSFELLYLENDKKSGNVKKSMDGTDIGIETNNLYHFFRQIGNYWKDCDHLKLPLFFEQPPVSDSTADYIELNFRQYGFPAIAPNTPFRIVLRNKRPLFIPLNRKEFMQYLIARANANLRDIQKDNDYDGKQNYIKKAQDLVEKYHSLLNSMSPSEAAAPARLDYNKSNEGDPTNVLIPVGRNEGTGLYKINPDYYDHSPGSPAAQLIIVYYQLPMLGPFLPDHLNYLQQKTLDIFNHLDYHALKASMQ